MNKYFSHVPKVLLILILGQLLPYKFSQSDQSQHIFSTIWDWIWLFLGHSIWDIFSEIWGYLIWSTEFIAILLLLIGWKIKRYQLYGSILATIILSGAVFFHIFSPLWINVGWDGWYLFILSIVWLISAISINIKEKSSCNIS